jgi:adenosylcobinamide kinase/adenosylcobinamide-phosphate guanylyltransferase
MKVLVYGGSASGKSSFAEEKTVSLFEESSSEKKSLVYLATMDRNSGGDSEERIRRHREMRQGKGFSTVESSVSDCDSLLSDLLEKLSCAAESSVGDSVLLEDVGNLVARVVFADFSKVQKHSDDSFFSDKIFSFAEKASSICSDIVFVSNDIFLEKIDLSDIGMLCYFKTLSSINKRLSSFSDEVFRVVAGIPIELKKV